MIANVISLKGHVKVLFTQFGLLFGNALFPSISVLHYVVYLFVFTLSAALSKVFDMTSQQSAFIYFTSKSQWFIQAKSTMICVSKLLRATLNLEVLSLVHLLISGISFTFRANRLLVWHFKASIQRLMFRIIDTLHSHVSFIYIHIRPIWWYISCCLGEDIFLKFGQNYRCVRNSKKSVSFFK